MISLKPSKNRSGSNGFTLIEVMISLTIMTAITTLAFTGLSIGMDSWTRGTREIDRLDERATLERLLRRQLALADPAESHANVQNKPVVLFSGTASRIDFVSNYSLVDGPCDFRGISYFFDGQKFRYAEKPLFALQSPDDGTQGEPIATLRSARFRFLKRNKDTDPSWADQWNYGDGLPMAVEVRLENDTIVIPLVNSI